jgi:hypothetical protein
MDDFSARIEGNKIVANIIRGYQRQLAAAQADLAAEREALTAETARADRATAQATRYWDVLSSVAHILRRRNQAGWEERILGVVDAALREDANR